MKIKNNILYILTGVIMLATSCSKDFLDKDINGVLPLNNYFKTDEEIQEGLMACYDILQWSYAADWNSMYMVKTLPSDETNAGGGNESDQPPYQKLDDFSFSSENPPVLHAFRSMYFGISRANAIINNVTPDTDVKKEMIAEAKGLRAYFYFELVSMFGDVPLMLSLPTSADEYIIPGSPKADIYAQIEKDLNEAIPDLKLKSQQGAENVFRLSKGAAQSILGKALLYQEKWADAAKEFDEVINSGEYSLQADYSTLFLKESEYGVESIFEVSYVTSEAYNWGTFRWGGNRTVENNIHLQLMGPRGEYLKSSGTTGLIGGWGFNYPTKESYQVFVDEGDNVRKKASVISEADLVAAGGEWDDGGQAPWGYEGYFRMKYGTIASETNTEDGAVDALNYGTNQRLIRYADVLLMAAEAKFKANGGGQAELDLVRARAGLGSKPISMDAIKIERQLELSFEGVRYLDLIRWGDAENVLKNQGFNGNGNFVKGKHELYPIPLDEINNNPKMVQNPGW